jgi:TonB family protein
MLTAAATQQADEAALLRAASEGRVDDVRALLDQGLDVNARNEDGWTPLLFAAHRGHTEVVTLLLERVADVNVSNSAGWTPLIAAALSGHTEVVGLLLEHGADPHAKSTRTADGDSALTALIVAARYGYGEIVNALLDGGAEVNATSRNGVSALEAAVSGGHAEVVTLLVERGAAVSRVVLDPSKSRPEVRDRARAGQIIFRNYPENLKDAMVGGTVHVWALVGSDGRVLIAQLGESSGHQALDLGALSAVRQIEFIPAHRDGVAVPAWMDYPIVFEAPHMVGPELRDPWSAGEIISRHYPTHLRDARIGGTVHVSVLIDTSGRVQNARVVRSSGRGALDSAALRAVREFLFTPASRGGVPIPMWLEIPITFGGR